MPLPGDGEDDRILGQRLPLHSRTRILLPPPAYETGIADLIHRERQTMPRRNYLQRCRSGSINLIARQDSITWVLKVHAHYQFRPVTALLAVSYFDRVLSVYTVPEHYKAWPFQLLCLACLSLAAKMEELNPPNLRRLQVCRPRFFFDLTTVQKMEVLVMKIMRWRLHSVTPFHYLYSFASKIPRPSSPAEPHESSSSRIVSSACDLILRTLRVFDFLGFMPSTIAAAAVLSAAGEGSASLIIFHEKEMVRRCHHLMEEYLVDPCPAARVNAIEAEPASPVGVIDAAFFCSCETRSMNRHSQGRRTEEEPNRRL